MIDRRIVPIKEQYDNWYGQMADLTKKWEQYGILRDLKDEYHRRMMAVLMENQRLINEVAFENDDGLEANQFRRLSIPLVRRVFGKAPFLDWVCVQPMLGPTSDLFMKSITGEWVDHALAAKTRFLKTEWPQDSIDKFVNVPAEPATRLNYEVEITAILASELADELCHEVIKDLCNNCTMETFTLDEGSIQSRTLNNAISYGSHNLRGSLGRNQANWMIVSEKMYDLLRSEPAYGLTEKDDMTWTTVSRVFHVGSLKNDTGEWAVYCDRDFADNNILFGYRGDWQEAGYFYTPYVFLTKTPPVERPGGVKAYPLMTRYGKFIKRGGSNYYRLVTINNVVFTQDEPHAEEIGEVRSSCTLRVQEGELETHTPDQCSELGGPGELVPEDVLQCDDAGDDCGGLQSVGHVEQDA